jgi:hypothetical protein
VFYFLEGIHVANWLIGQVRTEKTDTAYIDEYAKELGADPDTFARLLWKCL